MKTITVEFLNGTTKTYDPHEFYEEFHDDLRVYVDRDDANIPSDTGKGWADDVNSDYAIADWDDLVLAEVDCYMGDD